MLSHNALKLVFAGVLTAGMALGQTLEVQTRTLGKPQGDPSPVLLTLELRRHGDAASLELRGGIPGNVAAVAVGNGSGAPTADSPRTCGNFDAQGCFAVPVDLRRLRGTTVSCQGQHAGTTVDGDAVDQTSAVLELTVTEVAEVAPAPVVSAPDLSLLLLDLGPNRRDDVLADLKARDLAGALAAALNSAGDNLQVKVSGKVMVKVNGIDVGGSVAYTARMARDKDDFTVAIGEDVAALVGVKATDEIGLEGGVSLGADEVYRFDTSGEAARGLIGIAIQQALGPAADLLRDEHLAKLQQARAAFRVAMAALREYRELLPRLRMPEVEEALAAAAEARSRKMAADRRMIDGAVRLLGWLAGEVQFVREHSDGAELRASMPVKAEIKIGEQKFDCGTASFGARADQKYETVVRISQSWGGPVRKVDVRSGASFGVAATAGAERPFHGGKFTGGVEAEFRASHATRTTWERDRHGNFGTPAELVELKGTWKVGPLIREIVLCADKQVLGPAALVALQHVHDGDLTSGWGPLGEVPFTITVQDKLCRALRPGFGISQGVTAKLGLDLSWTDAGGKRSVTATLPAMAQALTDPEHIAATASELARQVSALQE